MFWKTQTAVQYVWKLCSSRQSSIKPSWVCVGKGFAITDLPLKISFLVYLKHITHWIKPQVILVDQYVSFIHKSWAVLSHRSPGSCAWCDLFPQCVGKVLGISSWTPVQLSREKMHLLSLHPALAFRIPLETCFVQQAAEIRGMSWSC